MPPEIKYLSPSQIGKFRRCPRQWKFQYIDKLPDPAGEKAFVGSFVHIVLEKLMELPKEQRLLARAKEIANECWPEFTNDKGYKRLGLDNDRVRAFKWAALDAINGLWDVEDPKEVDVLATEERLKVPISGVPFVGVVDRLDGTADRIVVNDYKSGKAPGKSYERERLEQVMLYALAVNEIRGVMPERVRLLYLGQRIVESVVTKQKAANCRKRLVATWEDVNGASESGEFPAVANALCAWCPYLQRCETGQAHVMEGRRL